HRELLSLRVPGGPSRHPPAKFLVGHLGDVEHVVEVGVLAVELPRFGVEGERRVNGRLEASEVVEPAGPPEIRLPPALPVRNALEAGGERRVFASPNEGVKIAAVDELEV